MRKRTSRESTLLRYILRLFNEPSVPYYTPRACTTRLARREEGASLRVLMMTVHVSTVQPIARDPRNIVSFSRKRPMGRKLWKCADKTTARLIAPGSYRQREQIPYDGQVENGSDYCPDNYEKLCYLRGTDYYSNAKTLARSLALCESKFATMACFVVFI